MALISCPECNKEISSHASFCVGCGFPIDRTKEIYGYDIQSILKDAVLEAPHRDPNYYNDPNARYTAIYYAASRIVKDDYGLSNNQVERIVKTALENPDFHQVLYKKSSTQTNAPKCPTCSSTNIQRISAMDRATTSWAFGLADSNIGKTMVCKNCRYKW